MPDSIILTSYGLCGLAYLGLAIATVSVKWKEPARRWPLLWGCVGTVLWAAAVLADATLDSPPVAEHLFEGIRNLLWLVVLLVFLGQVDAAPAERIRRMPVNRILPPLALIVVAAALLPALAEEQTVAESLDMVRESVQIVVSVLGLLCLENLVRSSGPEGRWGLKHLGFGLGAIFAYDFFLHADSLLLRRPDVDFEVARGMVTTLAAPLLGISLMRIRRWSSAGDASRSFSHKGAFHSAALLGSGLYLLVMAAIAYYIRGVGGRWGGSLQITFMIGVVLLLFVVFSSGMLKSQAKILIQKYFFTYKYDYREEWTRFVQAVSSRHPLTLGERLLHAIAAMMDSPAGALWIWHRQDDAFCPDAAWNYHGARPSETQGSPLIAFFQRKNWIVELDEFHKWPQRYEGLTLPPWITGNDRAWLVVPFVHRGEVLAFLVLDKARAPRDLDWEDRDLLKTVAAHGAGYLAEEIAADALSDAQRLEEFNRRFAFVAHDIKNVVGQMGLLVDNADRFGDNPEFQKDMLDTVRNSVARMRTLLAQLTAKRQPASLSAPTDVGALTAEAVERWRKTSPGLTATLPGGNFTAMAVRADLVSVLDFLIDNALSAAGPRGTVHVALRRDEGNVIIDVSDNGPGMGSDFIRDELFRPLKSTKASGYGIGAYQTRHLVRAMGGQLDVESELNKGTTMRILLPTGDALPKPPDFPLRSADSAALLKAGPS